MNSRITLVILLNLLLYQDQATAGLRTIIDRLEAIEVSKESKVQWVTLHVVPHNNTIAQAELLALQDLDTSKLKIVIEVVRCFVREAPDTCEYFKKLKPPNACMFINADNMAWTTMTKAFTPRLSCPLKKRNYVADAIIFDANKWNIFPLEKWYFKIAFKLYEGDILSMGFILEAHVIRIH